VTLVVGAAVTVVAGVALAGVVLLALGFLAGAVYEGCRRGGSIDLQAALRAHRRQGAR
jgi:hypothetical protein